jgi:hypothetical protein
MTVALRLARSLYDAAALDEAAAAFSAHATIDRADDASHFVLGVRSSRKGAERERRIAGELANWALGATIRKAKKGTR